MSTRHTPESLLISAVLNSGDPYTAKALGVIPEHFRGLRDEYRWLLDQADQYGDCPTPTQLQTKFPDFTYSEDQEDARWPASEVKRKFAARDLMARCAKAMDNLTTGNVEDAYEAMKGLQLETVSSRPEDALNDPNFLDGYDEQEEERILTPWPTLNSLTNGVGPGELWYLAARQGNGKSSYLVDMAVEAVFAGHSVCFYSMEMNKRQIQVRAQAAMAHRLGIKVDAKAMLHRKYDPKEYSKILGQIKDRLEEAGGLFSVHVPSMGRVSPSVITSLASEYDMHMVDYIGLMRTDDGKPMTRDWRDIAEVSNELKQIALAKNTRIISASQVNREGTSNGAKPPKLEHLAQSDHLGNDGDVVLTMKRYGLGAGIFSVEKNRHGPSYSLFYTRYSPNEGAFDEITSDRANDIKDNEGDQGEPYV